MTWRRLLRRLWQILTARVTMILFSRAAGPRVCGEDIVEDKDDFALLHQSVERT